MAQWLTNPTRNHEVAGSVPALAQWVAVSCGVGHRRSLDPMLLWLWWRLAGAALIRLLAWEPPHAAGEKRAKKNPPNACGRKAREGRKKEKRKKRGVPVVVQWLTNPTRNHEVAGSVPALAQWVNDPALPELWCRLQTRLGSRIAVALS